MTSNSWKFWIENLRDDWEHKSIYCRTQNDSKMKQNKKYTMM